MPGCGCGRIAGRQMDRGDRVSGTRRKLLEDALPGVRSEATIDSPLRLPVDLRPIRHFRRHVKQKPLVLIVHSRECFGKRAKLGVLFFIACRFAI